MLTANMKMIAECADKLAHLGEKLFNMTEMKYKVGDRVLIKSLDWYYDNRDRIDEVACGNTDFIPDMVKYCGGIATISAVLPNLEVYHIKEDGGMFYWTDEMIEGLAEFTDDRLFEIAKNAWDKVDEEMDALDKKLRAYWDGEQWSSVFECPQGYIFKDENGNVINATKIVLERKKKEYPKTYEECRKVLQYDESLKIYPPSNADVPEYDALGLFDLLETLRKLLICRDTYWKIAGEEMGLGKPWEPNYDSGADKFGIICLNGVVQESNPTTNWERHLNKIFDFPTRAMRDAFYGNFKELIEECKELL